MAGMGGLVTFRDLLPTLQISFLFLRCGKLQKSKSGLFSAVKCQRLHGVFQGFTLSVACERKRGKPSNS